MNQWERDLMLKLLRFLRNENGNMSILFAMSLMPIMATVGVGIDYSRMSGSRTQIQSALDAAVLAGVVAASKDQEAVARGLFSSNISSSVKITSQSYAVGTDTLTGEVSAELPMVFGWIFNTSSTIISAKSTAKVDITSTPSPSPSAGSVCLLILDPSKYAPFIVNGPAYVNAPDCEIHVKATGNPAAAFNSGGTPLDMKRICIEGSSVSQLMTPIKNLELNCKTASNPYVGKYPAPSTACTNSGQTYFSSVTMNPGVYCGNTVFMGNSTVTLNPGVYVIKGGNWTVNGQINVVGTGVTFYFPDTSAIIFNGPITVDLKSPTSGTYKGVLMFEAEGLAKSPFVFNGTSNNQLDGLVYLPSRDVVTQLASTSGSHRTTMVVNSMVWNAVRFSMLPHSDTVISAPGTGPAPTVSKKPYLVY